jgi:hypothetical protein
MQPKSSGVVIPPFVNPVNLYFAMKQRLFLFLMAALFLHCTADSQDSRTSIKGEGEVIKKELTLDAFEGVQLSFAGDVVLTQGSPQKVVVEGQSNIIDNIRTTVKGGVWNIGYEKNVREAKPVKVYITMSTLKEASVAGSGNISSTSKFTGLKDLDINVSGSGNVDLDIESQSTDAAVSGSGGVTIKGMTQALDVAISGSGNVHATQLKASSCEVSIAGSGDAEVHVNGDLKASISGSGAVHYSGDANVSAKVAGSGKVTKM